MKPLKADLVSFGTRPFVSCGPRAACSIATNSGSQLRKPELTFALIEVMQHIESYGGVLAAMTCALLSDVMNSDPHVVYHVHQSGIAKAFFDMLASDRIRDGVREPALPGIPELITSLPNVISALSLTAEGASKVKDANPFPYILRIFVHRKYAMPRSRWTPTRFPTY